MIKAVIFDIGGVTIKNPMPPVYRALGKTFKKNRARIEEVDERLNPLIETCSISQNDFWKRFANSMGIKDVSLLKRVCAEHFKKNARLDPGVVRIIKRVDKEGYRVAALSNTTPAHMTWHKKLGHYKFFDKLFLSCKLGMKKPDVRIYKYAADKLGVETSECVFIDDKKRNVIGAKRAGMKAILFKNPGQLQKELKRYL